MKSKKPKKKELKITAESSSLPKEEKKELLWNVLIYFLAITQKRKINYEIEKLYY